MREKVKLSNKPARFVSAFFLVNTNSNIMKSKVRIRLKQINGIINRISIPYTFTALNGSDKANRSNDIKTKRLLNINEIIINSKIIKKGVITANWCFKNEYFLIN